MKGQIKLSRLVLMLIFTVALLGPGLCFPTTAAAEVAPAVVTQDANVHDEYVTLEAEVNVYSSNSQVINHGFYYNTDNDLLEYGEGDDDNWLKAGDALGPGKSFAVDLYTEDTENFDPDENYYYRAYVIYRDLDFGYQDIAYGRLKSFEFNDSGIPEVTTNSATDIEPDAATLNGEIVSFGDDDEITEYGFYYGTSSSPSTQKEVGDDSDNIDVGDDFYYDLSGLKSGTKYYFKAYARNSEGIAYGSVKSFTTDGPDGAPQITTNSATNIDSDSATLNGEIVSFGDDDEITEYGFYYGTSSSPSTQKEVGDDGDNIDVGEDFYYDLNGLKPGTKYYLKAYARNNQGIAYGSVKSFTTQVGGRLPKVTTNTTDTGSGYATLYGVLTDAGESAIESYGFYYGLTSSPTTRIVVGNRLAEDRTFSYYLAGLSSGTRYYVKAYVTNGEGTAYGSVQSFTVSSFSPSVFTIGSNYYYQISAYQIMDAAPYIKDSRTYMPIRYVGYALGLTDSQIIWNEAAQKVTLTKGFTTVTLVIGSRTLHVNGQAIRMDVAPEITNGRTYLPIAWVAQAFGRTAVWDANAWTVTIR